jgi:7-cyano-7-deazaguanine synthase in queuosine biosynthesis
MNSGAGGMSPERRIVCRGGGSSSDASDLTFDVDGVPYAVALKIAQLSRRLVADIPAVLYDLLEIAAYVYAADAAIPRGGPTDERFGKRWRRRLHFEIAVRDPDRWSSDAVRAPLEETLGFLSDDDYQFTFQQLDAPPSQPRYLRFAKETDDKPDEVLLFSGGLDSLAGALEVAHTHQKSVALVSCRSATKLMPIQNTLVRRLAERVGRRRITHIPVAIQLRKGANVEDTHRSRSFLYAALAAATAQMFGLSRIRFYENGVVSLNLPPANQVIGGRATRSTHPQALAGLARVFSALLGRTMQVENPFALKTKQEVLRVIANYDASDLIRFAHSCAHVRGRTIMHPHCGLCSQCVDRRIAIEAEGLSAHEPAESYAVDPLLGPREKVTDREMALAYVRNARRFTTMTPEEFLSAFGEVQRALAHFREPPETALALIHELHRRHGQAVKRAVDPLVQRAVAGVSDYVAHPDSLVMLVGQDVFGGGRAGLQASPPSLGPAHVVEPDRVWTLALNLDARMVSIRDAGELRGVSAELVEVLAERFLASAGAGLPHEEYALASARDLASTLNIAEETVRRRINRARRQIAEAIGAAGLSVPPDDAIIENIPWSGYRLNPDTTRVVVAGRKPASKRVSPHPATQPDRMRPFR